jgi:hypothetical protein
VESVWIDSAVARIKIRDECMHTSCPGLLKRRFDTLLEQPFAFMLADIGGNRENPWESQF